MKGFGTYSVLSTRRPNINKYNVFGGIFLQIDGFKAFQQVVLSPDFDAQLYVKVLPKHVIRVLKTMLALHSFSYTRHFIVRTVS
jgi:hypothetical protein